jgi:lipid-A-disaccharide synthase
MQQAGMELTVHYREMEVMGFLTVAARLPKIYRFLERCKKDLRDFKPDVVVLIDYGGFNMLVARFAHAQGLRVFYYIPPKIWAWYTGRARSLKKWVERLFLILPFEKTFYERYGLPGDYVGNPVLDAIKQHRPQPLPAVESSFIGKPVIALLPGSRRGELKHMVPVLVSVVQQRPGWQFVVASVTTLDEACYQPLRGYKNVVFVADRAYDVLTHARAAIVTSGTATLETALLRVPQVVVYKTGAIEYHIARMVIQVPYVSLVNLVAGEPVVKEMIQHHCSANEMVDEITRLIDDATYRQAQLSAYDRIYRMLDVGSASENAASLMVKYLARKQNIV